MKGKKYDNKGNDMNSKKLHGPFLEGEKVILNGIEESDLMCKYFNWFNDQKNDIYTSHALFPNNMKKMKEYYNLSLTNELLLLAITFKQDNIHVGNVSLSKFDWINGHAEFSIIIGEQGYHGKGIATEATNLIVNYAFKRYNLHVIYLYVHAENKAALKVYNKIGFTLDGKFKDWFLKEEKYYDLLLMSLLKSDYYT